jgi:NitT/TauT family transport system substrate-binding protein
MIEKQSRNIRLTTSNSRLPTTILFIAVIVGLALAGLSGCSPGSAGTAAPAAQVGVQLSWLHTVEFAGFYAAIEHGYYAQENVDVQLHEGGFDEGGNYIDPVQHVLDGDVDFGIFNAEGLILARAEGKPVVAVATIFQRSPVALFSLARSGIRTPQDLVGKRVGVSFGSDDTIFTALLHTQGIDPTEVTMVPADPSLSALTSGEVDAQMGYVTNEPVQLRQQGYDVNLILPSDYGIDLYSNAIFTREDTIATKPDVVERFLRATLQGYEEAMSDPEHAAQLAVERNDELDPDGELASMHASLPLLRPAGSRPGMMTAESWQAAHQFLLDQNILSQAIDVSQVYDLGFLNKIYE